MKAYLRFDAEELEISSEDGSHDRLAWKSVREVIAFKDDAWAYDIICLGFRFDDQGRYFNIDEEVTGYKALVDALPTIFPGIRDDWFSDVAFPAFEPCLTTLWGEPDISDPSKQNASLILKTSGRSPGVFIG
jgi:hypothetical protein